MSQSTATTDRPLQLAMLGLGFSHPITFAKLLRDNALRSVPGKAESWRQGRIAYVWDDDPQAARSFAAEYGATAVDSPDQIPLSEIDGVLIETKNGERAHYATPFLQARVPTFIDKPICTTPDDLRLILDTAREHRTPLFSCSSARYEPAVSALRGLIDGGELGTLLSVRASVSHTIKKYLEEPHTWQDDIQMGGGTIVNMGIHGMEPLVALLGPDVESVTCIAEKRHFTTSLSEDTALVTLRWRNGVMATLEIFSGTAVGGRSFAACGSAGVVETAGSELRWWGGKKPAVPVSPGPQNYVPMLEAFFDMIRTGQPPLPLAETEAVALSLFAARQSAAEGRTVNLSELRPQ